MPKILIADDEPHIRFLLELVLEELEDEGVDIIYADNGETALEIIRDERPALVFLDIMMPRMNGFDVCSQVKADPDLAGICVVLLTAKGQESDRHKGLESGADSYMTKPFNPDQVLSKAREVLEL